MQKIRAKIIANIKRNKNGCWVWQKSLDRDGYGRINVDRKHEIRATVS